MTKVKLSEAVKTMNDTAGQLLNDVQKAVGDAQLYAARLRGLEERIMSAEALAYEEKRRREEEEERSRETADLPPEPTRDVEPAAQVEAIETAKPAEPVKQEVAKEPPKLAAVAVEPAAAPVAVAEVSVPEIKVEPVQPKTVIEAKQPETEPLEVKAEKASEPEVAAQPTAASAVAAAKVSERPAARTPAPQKPAEQPQRDRPRPAAKQQPALQGPRPGAPGPRPPVAGPRPPLLGAPGPRPPVPGLPPRGIGPRPGAPANRPPTPGLPPRPAAQAGVASGPRPFTPGGAPRPGAPAGPGRPGQPQGGAPRQGGFAPRPGGGAPAGGGGRPGGFGGGRPGFGGPKKPDLVPAQEKERVSNYDPNKSQYDRTTRQTDDRRPRPKKTLAREAPPSAAMDDDVMRGRKRKGKQQLQFRPEPVVIENAVMTAPTILVRDLCERIGKTSGEIIKKLFLLGIMATINQEIDFDTAQLISADFGIELQLKLEKTAEETLIDEDVTDDETNLITRPPVVTIMGHVDHGKTTLLDYIRKANVAEGEAGGITQHIGAYTVTLPDTRRITFLDTPGHEAFTSMRARGAQATDIAVLVVSAVDGVMPQSVEAINHAKAAKVPLIVAINMIDRPAANVERVKQMLTEHNLLAEEWGGDTVIAPVSAKTGEGVSELLDMILLTADICELSANPNRKARGVIIEAQLDKGRGPVATVLVQNGTLLVGDTVVAGTAYGRVRAMMNDKGERVESAGPSDPVEVVGLDEVPDAGDLFYAVEDDRLSRQVAEERRDKQQAERFKSTARVSLDDLFTQIEQGQVQDLNIIIKADVQGSAEAVKQSMEKLTNDKVRIRVIHSAVGAVNRADVMLAATSGAVIIGFNVRPDTTARAMADREGIDIRLYRVIYQAIEDIEKAMKGMLAPEFKEIVLGRAEVRQVFRVTGVGAIAGCYVVNGLIRRSAQIRLLRDNIIVHEGKIDSLKRFKDDAREVAQGFECGVGLERYNDIKDGDVIECFIMEEIPRD